MKNILMLFIIFSALNLSQYSMADDKKNDASSPTEKPLVDSKCQAPKWAIAIGHEEKWKLHNGCNEKKDDIKK